MKRILITGINSYIGNSFTKYIENITSSGYEINVIDLKSNNWKKASFCSFDVIIHLAAIVHKSNATSELYYKINRDLAVEVAKKAKNDGVEQFIFMSTMSVYGVNTGIITDQTIPHPKNAYGKSKLEAEKLLQEMESKNFKVSILRPPMIYGPNTVGNYPVLANFAKNISLFPKISNRRSMLYIDTLSIYLKKIIDNQLSGVFFPQNKEYVNTSELVKLIAEVNSRKVTLIPGFNCVIKFFSKYIPILNKVFGTLIYEHGIGDNSFNENNSILMDDEYIDFKKSIEVTEGKL